MTGNQPTIYATGGTPCAGKSTLLKTLRGDASQLEKVVGRKLAIPPDAFHSCNDLTMVSMPGYADAAVADKVEAFRAFEMPARELATKHLYQALKQGKDIIYDRTCGLADCIDFFAEAQKQGYRIVLHGVVVRPEFAIRRSENRIDEIPRHTSPELIRERHLGFANNFSIFVKGNEVCTQFDEVYLWHSTKASMQLISMHDKANGETIRKANIFNWFLEQSSPLRKNSRTS